MVAQRTKEIGIRVALGAAPLNIHGMILGYVARMTMVGGAAGLAAAIAAGRFAESLLFKLNGHDPFVLSGGVVVLSFIAFCAGFIPARRAANVDPMKALRYE
jgi:ABC-type antimicrobial peptide transport system permease subunit